MNKRDVMQRIDEAAVLRPALVDLAGHLAVQNTWKMIAPSHLAMLIREFGDRAAALAYVHRYAETIEEGRTVVERLLEVLDEDRLPRRLSDDMTEDDL